MRSLLGALVVAMAASSLGCDDPLQRQISVMPVVDEASLRTVPEGAVPVEPTEPATSLEEAMRLDNPVAATEASVERGATAFDYYCSHCHGSLGRGRVVVGASLDPAPPDLVRATATMQEGEIFGVITFGRGRSPALGPHVSVEDRWRIVRFLRTLRERREGVEPAWGQ